MALSNKEWMAARIFFSHRLEDEYKRNHGCLEIYNKEISTPFLDSARLLIVVLASTVVFYWGIILS